MLIADIALIAATIASAFFVFCAGFWIGVRAVVHSAALTSMRAEEARKQIQDAYK